MFQTYCVESLQFNKIHESILQVLETLIECHRDDLAIPEWKDLIPIENHPYLKFKYKIKRLVYEFSVLIEGHGADFLEEIRNFVISQNQIENLLDSSEELNSIDSDEINEKLKEIFEEGFELIKKTGLRQKHYSAIYTKLKSKTCPFCGYMALDAVGLKSEDLDHYLDRVNYFAAAANLKNLVPTCSKCNSRYKGTANLIFWAGQRRPAFNPYGNHVADISLRNTELMGENSMPNWDIEFIPYSDEVETWNQVYDVRTRLLESVLKPSYDNTLNELIDFFVELNLSTVCTNQDLLEALHKFYWYKSRNPEQGLGFLKSRVIDLLIQRVEQNDHAAIAMIRAALRQPQNEAA